MPAPDVARLVAHFGMTKLPVESTLFVSTYVSAARTADGAAASTAMLGLYARDPLSRSLFHRLAHDEVWHYHLGDPLRLVLLHADGSDEDVVLGPDVLAGHRVQHVVPAGTWQAGELLDGGEWALFGCTVAPGFTGEIFESGYAEDLVRTHPARLSDIRRLAVPPHEPPSMPAGFA